MWIVLLLTVLTGVSEAKRSKCPLPPSTALAGQETTASSSAAVKITGYVDGSVDADVDRISDYKTVIMSQDAYDRALDYWQVCVAYEQGYLPEKVWLQYNAARMGLGLIAVDLDDVTTDPAGSTAGTSAAGSFTQSSATTPTSGESSSVLSGSQDPELDGVFGAPQVMPKVVFFDFAVTRLEVFVGGAPAGSATVGESMHLPALTGGAQYDLMVRWSEASGFMDMGEPIYWCRDIRITADDKLHSIRAADMGAVRTCAPAAGPSTQETLMRMLDD